MSACVHTLGRDVGVSVCVHSLGRGVGVSACVHILGRHVGCACMCPHTGQNPRVEQALLLAS